MRYWWDKIKLVTDGLALGDNIQVLWFDTCWFALIWKWTNEYGTKWDPLNASETPCWSEWNCPNCQPKINNIKELPWWPNPCNDWDAFIMMSRTWTLKALCKTAFEDQDRKVATSSWDEEPWYLAQKIKACDPDWPISIKEKVEWNYHTLCVWFDPSKWYGKIINLTDWPWQYPTTQWVLVWDNGWWDWVEPSDACNNARYQYLAYDMKTNKMIMTCDRVTSLASWTFQWWYLKIDTDTWTKLRLTNNSTTSWNLVWWDHIFKSTDDIKIWTWEYLFEITTPWVYTITANCTMHNKSEAWVQAIRWWLFILEWANTTPYDTWDAKFDWRKYTKYITDEPMWSIWAEQNLELSIMSFNTVYIQAFPNASVKEPVKVWFAVSIDTNLHDAKMSPSQEEELASDKIEIWFTDWTPAMWPKTVISCVRNWDVPSSFKER